MARGRRSHSAKISAFRSELMLVPPSSFMGYFFPWKEELKSYDTSSFNSSYSDNRVSMQDIQVLINDLQSQPLFSPTYNDPWAIALLGFIIFIPVSFGISLYININTQFKIPLIPIFFFIEFIFICILLCKVKRNEAQRQADRKIQMDAVLAKHQQSTFGGKEVTIAMSTHGAFIAIGFNFRSGAQGLQMGLGMPFNYFPPGNLAQPEHHFAYYQQHLPHSAAGFAPQPLALTGPQPGTLSAPLF